MKNITIRKAADSDIEDMAKLLIELFSIEEDFEPDFEKHVKGLKLLIDQDSADIIVAEYNKQVIGMCTIQRLMSSAEGSVVGLIEDLVVNKSFRGKGTGSALLAEIEKISAEKGFSRLQLLADKTNIPALDFYQKKSWNSTNMICLRKNRDSY